MFWKWLNPGRFLVLGFAAVIFLGAILLLLPVSSNSGAATHPIDALFTATSAVCVTGLAVVDTADHYSVFGRTVIALLIQTGGLGISSIGVTFILLSGKRIGLRERVLVREALNLDTLKGIVRLVKFIILVTLCFEGIGTVLSFIVFSQDYPLLKALGISAFHAISAFNNAGFDILGSFQSLIPYQNNLLLNLTTCGLIIFGGLGYYVIHDILEKRSLRKLNMNSKIVLTMTASLLLIGTILLKLTTELSWLGAFFYSTSTRTAGFSTYAIGEISAAGLFVMIIFMFIGASPGSTGGGIKTTTAFTLIKSTLAVATNRSCTAFRRKIHNESIMKAFIIAVLTVGVICFNTLLISIIEPQLTFIQVLFETVSAVGTVGLSTGITPQLSDISKLILCLTMFIGRLGPLTMACIWSFQPTTSNLSYAEERVTIG